MAKAFAKDSISGSTATTPPSRSGPGSLPSSEYEDASGFSTLSVRAPVDRMQPMTGNFRRRKYYIPDDDSEVAVAAASPVRSLRDSTICEQLQAREHFMQVKIEGYMQKRSFGVLWTPYWVVLDQSAIRLYDSEQASISRPDAPVEEIPVNRLVPEIPRNHPTWVICTDDWTMQKVLYLRSGCEPPTWEDVASARLWYWALGEQRGTDNA
mmetsp:Transcript_142617/g.201760  ORF Transcript_142617/g.201760 Transcript_142617/m.201760 type:complete len:210 (-) Transcript_142617:174-803(-)